MESDKLNYLKEMKKMIQEEESKKDPCCGAPANITMSSISNSATITTSNPRGGWSFIEFGKASFIKQKHKYIPEAIYCDPDMGVTVVKWNDGTETKVTCDEQDTFDWQSGFAEALKIKVFGNEKARFKDFWEAVLSRRVFVGGKRITPLKYGRWEAQRKAELAKKKAKKEKANAKGTHLV